MNCPVREGLGEPSGLNLFRDDTIETVGSSSSSAGHLRSALTILYISIY